jgi:hypothetical protein
MLVSTSPIEERVMRDKTDSSQGAEKEAPPKNDTATARTAEKAELERIGRLQRTGNRRP